MAHSTPHQISAITWQNKAPVFLPRKKDRECLSVICPLFFRYPLISFVRRPVFPQRHTNGFFEYLGKVIVPPPYGEMGKHYLIISPINQNLNYQISLVLFSFAYFSFLKEK
jgi:hypothetical protein